MLRFSITCSSAQQDASFLQKGALIFCLLLIFLLSAVSSATARPGYEDFGAETVFGKSAEEAVDPKLVEERDEVAPPPLSDNTNSTHSLPGAKLRVVKRGLAVINVEAGSLAEKLGVFAGDILVSSNKISFENESDIGKTLKEVENGENRTLRVLRADKELLIPVVASLLSKNSSEETGETTADKTTILNVQDVEIATLIKTFSKLTKRNYIVDSTVKGKVTVHLPTEVSVDEALRLMDTILLLKGFTTVPVTENTWKVVSAKDAKQTTIPLIQGDRANPSDLMVTQLVRLKHSPAEELQQLLAQFISKDGIASAVAGTNSILLIDSEANIARLKKLISELDVPAVDQELTIVPILHADATDLAEKINEILGEEQSSAAPTTRSNRTNRTTINNRSTRANRRTTNTAAASNTRKAAPLKIIPDERTNSIIVVADEAMTLKVRALVEQLDSEVDRSGGRFYVYRLQHADAEQLGEILNNLISGAGETSTSTGSSTTGSSLSRNRNSRQSATAVNQAAAQARINSALQRSRDLLRQRQQGGAASEGRVNLEGEVSIAPDPATNSLIINASKADYAKLKEVIQQLDMRRRQVLVEATILEVTLTNSESFGVELQGTGGLNQGAALAQTNFGGLTNLFTNPAQLSDLTLAATSTGTLTLPGNIVIPTQAVLVSAASNLTNVNVLSSPTIMATDNEEAEIIVGQNVPFVTSTGVDSTNIGNTFNSIERQDVGITLRITPQISTGDFVVMRIFVEISNVVPGTAGDSNGPTTTVRTTETTVTVKHGQMIVTGGLLQDSLNDSERGVPFLKDIPVLGYLFKTQSQNIDKQNLLIFITPKIIGDQFDARETTIAKTEPFHDELLQGDISPKRTDVLKSKAIDNVIQHATSDGSPLPTMIRPPVYEFPTQGKPAKEALASKKSEDIEIRVKPKLPKTRRKQATATVRGRMNARKQTAPSSIAGAHRRFVVMKQIGGEDSLVPYTENETKSKTASLALSVLGKKASFFKTGGTYTHKNGGQFVVLGNYSSKESATKIHSQLKDNSWLTLTPAQSLKIENGTWSKN